MAKNQSARLKRWRTRVETAQRIRTDWETEWSVEQLERYWAGKQVDDRDDDLKMWFNHFFATERTQKPSLLPRSTAFLVRPKSGRKPFGNVESKVMEAVLKSISEQDDNLFNDASLALAQSFFRMGVLKMVYEPTMESNPRYGETPEPDVTGAVQEEPREVLTDEVYRFEWVDACRMLLPDDGPNMRRWTWIGEEIEVTLEEAKADDRFKHRSSLKANATANPEFKDGGARRDFVELDEDDEHARFVYYECWDINNKKLYAYADGQDFSEDEFLIDGDDYEPGIEDHPYAILRFIPLVVKPFSGPWPKPLTFDWLPIQEQYNVLRQMEINAARRAARKYAYEENTFTDEEEMDKFNSNADMQGVRINDITRPPTMLGETSINPDVWRGTQSLSHDWRIITGATGTRLGTPDADTATEAVLIEQTASLRDSDARLLVDKWIAVAGTKMLQLVKQTLTIDIYVQMRGFSDSEFKEFIQQPEIAQMLGLQMQPELIQGFLIALQTNPILQQGFRERYGNIKPLRVSRSELQFEADVEVLPSAARPLQQTQLLRLVSVLGPLAMTSPTFLEELLASFDLPQGGRIAEEIMVNLRQMQQQAQQAPGGQPGNAQRSFGTGPNSAVGGVLRAV